MYIVEACIRLHFKFSREYVLELIQTAVWVLSYSCDSIVYTALYLYLDK